VFGPAALATDEATIDDVIIHALDVAGDGCDRFVLLQATSPLRTAADIDGAVGRMAQAGAPACVSVTATAKHPAWMYGVDGHGRLDPVLRQTDVPARRQLLPQVYALNGAVYVADVQWFRRERRFVTPETVAWVMPAERSVDVDTELDLLLCDLLLCRDLGASR
jgi:N-acylneuraminate cytidylyltransferase